MRQFNTGCPSEHARSVEFRLIEGVFVCFFDGLKFIGARRFKKLDEAEQARIDFIETGVIFD